MEQARGEQEQSSGEQEQSSGEQELSRSTIVSTSTTSTGSTKLSTMRHSKCMQPNSYASGISSYEYKYLCSDTVSASRSVWNSWVEHSLVTDMASISSMENQLAPSASSPAATHSAVWWDTCLLYTSPSPRDS
eukprot:TRINITY_DN10804_c0_g1_i2.p1 TRINITY_DN10804_c0_g1~~TRINITY_DN10804_c0_g1_i2.p1  ORF type:complete len:133 (-),score=20.28 TRINITY_DN10804_c0_g1_i2:92-490(-)